MRHLAAIGYREPSFERFAVTFNHAADAPTEQASLLKGG
jgi:hypothetical protein